MRALAMRFRSLLRAGSRRKARTLARTLDHGRPVVGHLRHAAVRAHAATGHRGGEKRGDCELEQWSNRRPYQSALVNGQPGGGICPPGRGSADSSGGRHAETRHPIEHIASDLCLGPLCRQSAGLKSPTNDGLVPIYRSLDQAPAVVAGTALPAHAPCFSIVSMCRSRCVTVVLFGTAVTRGEMIISASVWRLAAAS